MMVEPVAVRELADYDVDPVRGFLPAADPIEALPPAYAEWDRAGARLSPLLMARQARSVLARLPELAIDGLESAAQRERAMLLLSFFGSAFVFEGPEPAGRLPRNLAVPWWRLAERLGRPAIAGHASLALHNWRRLDPNGPIALGNLACRQLMLGGLDEQWFYLVTVQIEADGGPAIAALLEAQRAVLVDQTEVIVRALEQVLAAQRRMQASLERMPEQCAPYVFYHRVRPYLSSWPEPGLIYAGVSDQPVPLAGGSAAQSPLVQALDAGLGVAHRHPASAPFLLEMRRYMQTGHRRFIEALEDGPSIRQYVLERQASQPILAERYNACIAALDHFRKTHMEIAVRYITHQAPLGVEAVGTGGTHFASFLGKAIKETREHRLDDDG